MRTPPRSLALPSRHAFTIPEMLAVVAIIIILISMLLPSLAESRKITWKAKCASNLHQQGVAMRGYITDTRYYPGHCGRMSNGRVAAVWPTRIREYANERSIFDDPAAPDGFQWQTVIQSGGPNHATQQDVNEWGYEPGELLLEVHSVPFSYAYNDWGRWNILRNPQRGLGADIRWGGLAVEELKYSKVASASDMIAVAEATTDGSWDFNIDPTNPREYPGKLHYDGTNVLFADAHVEWFLQSDLVDVNLGTTKGRDMSRKWNNHHEPDADQN